MASSIPGAAKLAFQPDPRLSDDAAGMDLFGMSRSGFDGQ